MSISNENGNINYSEEVLGNIIGLSIMECYGVVGMASKNAKDGLWKLLKADNLTKGVKLELKDDKLKIELFIIVQYGTKISEIANNIIQKIKYSVENYTGIEVSSVTVNVKGVRV